MCVCVCVFCVFPETCGPASQAYVIANNNSAPANQAYVRKNNN